MNQNNGVDLIAHAAAKHYLSQPNAYSISDCREKFEGKLLIEGGKAFIVFADESVLSVEKIVRAKFSPKQNGATIDV